MLYVKRTPRSILAGIVALASVAMLPATADAGPGEKGHGHGQSQSDQEGHDDHSMPGGMPGNASDVSRTVLLIAKDMEFNLKKIQVKAGETVRFVIRNKGELLHEFTIGTPEMQKEHQKEMMKMMEEGTITATSMKPGMHHSHGNSAMIEPGEEAELIWMFHEDTELEFGCNIPGHYESGMKGEFVISGGA